MFRADNLMTPPRERIWNNLSYIDAEERRDASAYPHHARPESHHQNSKSPVFGLLFGRLRATPRRSHIPFIIFLARLLIMRPSSDGLSASGYWIVLTARSLCK
jgi:hypothetical protein